VGSFPGGGGGGAWAAAAATGGGGAAFCFFCGGGGGGRRDFAVETRVGVGGRPGTPGPVGGPDLYFALCRKLSSL